MRSFLPHEITGANSLRRNGCTEMTRRCAMRRCRACCRCNSTIKRSVRYAIYTRHPSNVADWSVNKSTTSAVQTF